jgi:hypothetical protein
MRRIKTLAAEADAVQAIDDRAARFAEAQAETARINKLARALRRHDGSDPIHKGWRK